MCIRDRVFIDPASPNVPSITLSTEQWTNTSVTATVKDNGDAHSGVARTEYSLDGGSWTTYSGVLSIEAHGKHTVSARAIDNVGRISGTASKTALVDKVMPVISKVEQQPNSCLLYTSTPEEDSIEGVSLASDFIKEASRALKKRIHVCGLLICRVDMRYRKSRTGVLKIKKLFGPECPVYPEMVPDRVCVADARNRQVSVIEDAPESEPAQAYQAVCDLFLREVESYGSRSA